MVSLLSLVAIAVFVSSLVVRVVRVCACARWVTLMVYFPAMALPAVVALNAVVLLVVLVVFSFGRQMAREKREHLIRALSHAVTSGVAALAVAGWCFLPDLGAMLAKGTVAGTVALIILIVLGLALAVASTLWVRDADPDPDIRYPWIGTGLMPVMLMGVTIAATALVLGRIIG